MILFEAVRSLLGWSNEKIVFPKESAIIVYSHTSFLDILSIFLYFDQFLETGMQTVVIIQDKWYTRLLGFIVNIALAPSIHKKGSNGLEAIYQQVCLKTKNLDKDFLIPISPKGTIKKAEWRTGYYYLAKKLNCGIYVLTPDFSKRRIVSSDKVYHPNDYTPQELEKIFKSIFATTGVINIENAEHDLTLQHACPYECCLPFDFCLVSMLSFLPYAYAVLTRTQNYFLQCSMLFCLYYSTVYHMNMEYSYIQDKRQSDSLKAKERNLVLFVFMLQLYETFTTPQFLERLQLFPIAIAWVTGVFFFFNAMPRDHMKPRNKYALFHGFFHVCAGIFLVLLVPPTS